MIVTLVPTICVLGLVILVKFLDERFDERHPHWTKLIAVMFAVNSVVSCICLVIVGVTHIPYVHKHDVMEIESRRTTLVLRLEVMNSTDDASLISDIVQFNTDREIALMKLDSEWVGWLHYYDIGYRNVDEIDISQIERKATEIEILEDK